MTAAVFALAMAVVMVIVYGVFAERLDYASVRRRQLDVTAALTAAVCLAGIVYGGAATRGRLPESSPPTPQPTVDAPSPQAQRAVVEVAGSVAGVTDLGNVPVQLLAGAIEDDVAQGGQEIDVPVGASEGRGPEGRRSPGAAAATLEPVPLATLMVPEVSTPTAVTIPPSPTIRATTPTATATAVNVVVTRVPTVRSPATWTPPAPTAVPPTQMPLPLPSATPHCGDPYSGLVAMSDLSANADRDGQDLLVRFRARVRNDASFPLTVAEISATALNQVAGSEQYGNLRLADIAIEPGAVITLEGTVVLTKLPPPFGRTELCLSFAVESCGVRAERLVRQCANVRGF